MTNQDPVEPFDWQRMLLHDFPATYLAEVALRTLIMFTILLIALSLSGKREVRQLSVYELVLLIGLGSAAGDPMFYHDVPLASALVVFIVMIGAYKLITRLSDRNRALREKLEGKAVYVVENGVILHQNFDDEDIGKDELFTDLRQAGLKHLGQVELAIMEPNGAISIYQYPDTQVRPGLPILPHLLKQHTAHILVPGLYACIHCGHTQAMQADQYTQCPICENRNWVGATGP